MKYIDCLSKDVRKLIWKAWWRQGKVYGYSYEDAVERKREGELFYKAYLTKRLEDAKDFLAGRLAIAVLEENWKEAKKLATAVQRIEDLLHWLALPKYHAILFFWG